MMAKVNAKSKAAKGLLTIGGEEHTRPAMKKRQTKPTKKAETAALEVERQVQERAALAMAAEVERQVQERIHTTVDKETHRVRPTCKALNVPCTVEN
jgi:poly-D-alanine transfer protein DltD